MRTPRLRLAVAASAVALLAAGCLAPAAPDGPAPPNSPTPNTMDLVGGLDHPWDIAFVGGLGSTALVTERNGNLSMFDPAVGTPSKKLVGIVAHTLASGESGLLGLAVDPSFATNNFVYVCVSTTASGAIPASNEVRRLTLNLAARAGNGIVAEQTLLRGMPVNSFHDGCRLRFQPGANPPALWVTMGDAGMGTAPQDLGSLGGKILRAVVNNTTNRLETYPGNPFAWTGNPVAALIYTYGHRNPQGIAFQPGTNAPYNSEHGPNINDEVNKLVAGGNGGWRPDGQPGYDQNVPMTNLLRYPNAMRPVWRSGDTFTLAPSGITFIENRNGVDWKGWNGALAVAFLKNTSVRIMSIGGQGDVTNVFRPPELATFGRVRSIVEGPDGALYISTDNGFPNDHIWKVTP